MPSPANAGRFTPKKTAAQKAAENAPKAPAYAQSGRYTPPIAKETLESAKWVPYVMFTLLILGLLVIVLNYMGALPGATDNKYLLVGIVSIAGGFVVATKLR